MRVRVVCRVCVSCQAVSVYLGEVFPPGALVVHQVPHAVPVFAVGGEKARFLVQWAPILVQPLESGQVSMISSEECVIISRRRPMHVVLPRPF